MSTTLPADIQARVHAQIQSGNFSNADDVLREALSTLEKRQSGIQQLRELVGEADNDIAAGRVGPFDVKATIDTVRNRLSTENSVD